MNCRLANPALLSFADGDCPGESESDSGEGKEGTGFRNSGSDKRDDHFAVAGVTDGLVKIDEAGT